MSVTSSTSNMPSPCSQNQDKPSIMPPSQCIQQQSSVRSLSSEFDKCAYVPLVNSVSDSDALSKKLSATEGLYLCKISTLIANEKWHALDLVLWSSSNDATSCGYAPAYFRDEGDDDVMSSLNIGTCEKHYYPVMMREPPGLF
jgi:hypothetical protein